jgi:formylglycine-generating enzyme required for sulfatase activity
VSDSAFSFYFEPPGNALLPEQASVGGREKRTSQVGVYQAGRLGLYNMHDNVHEWCADDVPRPKDSPGEMQRIIRGGSWWSPPAFCQAIARFIEEPGSQRYNIGLRLARTRSAF